MSQKSLSVWLKIAIIIFAVGGLCVYGYILPSWGQDIAEIYPEFAYCYVPWLVFLTLTALPLYAALCIAYRFVFEIKKDNTFCEANAKRLKIIAVLLFTDACYYFAGNLVFGFLGMNHPGIVLVSAAITFIGIFAAAAAGVFSHILLKSVTIKNENDDII